MVKLFEKLLMRPSMAVLALGAVFLFVAMVGKIPYHETFIEITVGWRIFSAAVAMALSVVGVALIWLDVNFPRRPRPLRMEYGAFISSPMAAFPSDSAYSSYRSHTLAVIEKLIANCAIDQVYYAGRKIKSINGFEPKEVSAEKDLEAIRKSRYFVMLYPERLVSSVLFEAGYALALGRDSIYIVENPDPETLPFLMRELHMLSRNFPHVRIHYTKSREETLTLVEQTGKLFFVK